VTWTSLRSRFLAVAALLGTLLVGVGIGRGTATPDPEVALIGEARDHLLQKALGRPASAALSQEAIEGMLRALEDSYAEYLPPVPSERPDPGAAVDRVLGIDESRLLETTGVRGRVLPDGVGHLRLRLFSPGAGAFVRAEVERMIRTGASGIVLDLRGNRGGLVSEALLAAGVFIGPRPVFSYETAAGGSGERLGIGEPVGDLPLVICTDDRTGSAAELLAGAVQDAGRGLVVGGRTAGKGTVQRIVTLSDGSAIKFTAAVFRTPAGRTVDGTGIRPDVEVTDGARTGDAVLERARALVRSAGGR
jgi:C-terminal processing protease CtpA/Prc